MKTSPRLAQLCALAVLAAPLGLLGATNEEAIKILGLTKFVEPRFPDVARLDGFAVGYATVAVTRTPEGEPVDVLVLSATHPRMADAAVEAVRQWRFAPSHNPADHLAARTVRIGFKLSGLVVFPFGKDMHEDAATDFSALKLDEPVVVPSLQSLAQKPKALVQPMPVYPATLVSRKVAGHAAVSFYVDEEGRVRLPQVTDATAPEFAAAALAAVTQWRYEPPQLGGRNIVASDNWEFKFKATN